MVPIFLVAGTGLFFCGCTRVVREKDLFFPRRVSTQLWAVPPQTPTVQISPVSLPINHALILRGWLFSPSPSQRQPLRTMVYFYGNGETVAASAGRLVRMADALHCEILAVDYRGYGFSDGVPSFDALMTDALRVFDLMASRARASGLGVLIYGRSIGATVAVALAASRPASGMILEAPPTSAADVVPCFRNALPIPLRWLLRFRPSAQLQERSPQPVETIAGVSCPLLVIHGSDDRIIPIRFGRRMLAAAGSETKYFVEVPSRGHNNLDPTAGAVLDSLRAFVQQCPS